jgi:hypothetical protein
MHFDILVEDQSGAIMLDGLIPKVLDSSHTFRVHKGYKGIGRIPKGLKTVADVQKRILLDQLPRLLAAFGNTYRNYGSNYRAAVIVVCDLDRKSREAFEKELHELAASVSPCPNHAFCLAIEEGEAWFLGDVVAVKAAYPRAKDAVLNAYVNDSICGTWEKLADAVFPGGSAVLQAEGWMVAGAEKSRWAREITPHMDPASNMSPSFNDFVATLISMSNS